MSQARFRQRFAVLLTKDLKILRVRKARGITTRFPWEAGIRYKVEPKGQNTFLTIEDGERQGHLDCEDLVAWAVALEIVNGIPRNDLQVVVERTEGKSRGHVVYKHLGSRVDPSALSYQYVNQKAS